MKRTFKMQNLDCANCAAKMEDEIGRLTGVNSARVNFMMQKLSLDASADDFAALLDEAQDICTKYEPDCVIVR